MSVSRKRKSAGRAGVSSSSFSSSSFFAERKRKGPRGRRPRGKSATSPAAAAATTTTATSLLNKILLGWVEKDLLPEFPLPPVRLSPKSRSLVHKIYAVWQTAQDSWLRNMVSKRLILMTHRTLADVKRASSRYGVIPAAKQRELGMLIDPLVFDTQFTIFATATTTQKRDVAVTVVFPREFRDSVGNVDATKRVFENMVHHLYLWFFLIYQFVTPDQESCSQKLHLFVYLMDSPKQFGQGQQERSNCTSLHACTSSTSSVLGQDNVNTGFTYACQRDNEIHVYRKEEWFKVVMHESFHALGLDFAHDSHNEQIAQTAIQAMFPTISIPDVRLAETYAETWAVMLHTIYLALISSPTTGSSSSSSSFSFSPILVSSFISFPKLVTKLEMSLNLERIFNLYQAAKILRYNLGASVSYKDLVRLPPSDSSDLSDLSDLSDSATQKHSYKESTPIFSYYILRSMLFHTPNTFFEWCVDNNINGELCFASSVQSRRENAIEPYLAMIASLRHSPTYLACMEYMMDEKLHAASRKGRKGNKNKTHRRQRRRTSSSSSNETATTRIRKNTLKMTLLAD